MKFKFSVVSVTLVGEQCNDLVPFCADLKNCLLTTWWSPLHQLYKISKKVAMAVLHQIDNMNMHSFYLSVHSMFEI